jgi:hypothetical protein
MLHLFPDKTLGGIYTHVNTMRIAVAVIGILLPYLVRIRVEQFGFSSTPKRAWTAFCFLVRLTRSPGAASLRLAFCFANPNLC